MQTHAPFRIGVITDRMDDAKAQVIGGLESVVRPLGGVVLIIVHHRQNPVRGGLIRQLTESGRFDALLVLPLSVAGSGESRLAEVLPLVGDLPVVTVGARHPLLPQVDVAETVLAAELVQHLVEDCGRRRPVLVSSSQEPDGSSRRNRALEHATLARGITIQGSERLLRCVDQHSAQAALGEWLDVQAGAGAEHTVVSRPLDSVICGSDEIAVGVLAALTDRGYTVPDDVSVVGYGNTDASWGANPPLSSVDERHAEQGAAAGRYLLDRLAGRSVPTAGRVSTVTAGGLVVRGSSLVLEFADEPEPQTNAAASARPAEGEPSDALEQAKEAAWRRARRLEVARGAMVRSNEQVLARLTDIGRRWQASLHGQPGAGDQDAAADELAAVVRDFPEQVWWHAWLALLPSKLEAPDMPEFEAADRRLLVLTTSLLVERVLADARERRKRRAHAMSQQILELEQSLTGCASLVDLSAVVKAFLPRLGLVRCFIGLYEDAVPFDRPLPGHDGGTGRSRLVLRHGVPGDGFVAGSDRELWESAPVFETAQLLPPELSSELEHDTLMVQPIFGDESRFGYVAYEGSGQDRHVGETLRVAVARVLQTKARTDVLTARSEELATLVAERTAELQVEVAHRRTAQEELRLANEQLRFALLRDGLTGLYNRPALDEHLERAWRRMRRTRSPLSVMMCDVDQFKLYNDVSGHMAGDDCLRRVAHLIEAAAGRPGDMVARYGGEEFAVVLGDTDLAGADIVAARVVDAVRSAGLLHEGLGGEGCVTLSIGVASSAWHDDAESMLAAADRALYLAKADGRDCYRIEPAPDSVPDPMRVTTPTP